MGDIVYWKIKFIFGSFRHFAHPYISVGPHFGELPNRMIFGVYFWQSVDVFRTIIFIKVPVIFQSLAKTMTFRLLTVAVDNGLFFCSIENYSK